MSRYATTEHNRFNRIKSKIQDIYSQAVAYRLHHDRITDKLSAVYTSADYRKLTPYYRGYIAGLRDALNADIWRNHVAWMLGPSTGPTRNGNDTWTEEMSILCRLPGQLYGGHYWTDDNDKPVIDRPFTDYKPTN